MSRSPQRQRQRVKPRASTLLPRVPMVNLDALWTFSSITRQGGSYTLRNTCLDLVRVCEIGCSCVTLLDQSGFMATLAIDLEGILYDVGSWVSLFT